MWWARPERQSRRRRAVLLSSAVRRRCAAPLLLLRGEPLGLMMTLSSGFNQYPNESLLKEAGRLRDGRMARKIELMLVRSERNDDCAESDVTLEARERRSRRPGDQAPAAA